jgi:hypothetical protein
MGLADGELLIPSMPPTPLIMGDGEAATPPMPDDGEADGVFMLPMPWRRSART